MGGGPGKSRDQSGDSILDFGDGSGVEIGFVEAMLTFTSLTVLLVMLYGGVCFVGMLLFAFWIWMIVDCAQNEPPGNDKIVWIIIVITLNWIGALIYYFARRRDRSKGQFFRPEPPPPLVR